MGDVSPVRRNRCPDHRKLDQHHEFLLIAIVMENPCLHLHEMCSQILHTTGVQVSGHRRRKGGGQGAMAPPDFLCDAFGPLRTCKIMLPQSYEHY